MNLVKVKALFSPVAVGIVFLLIVGMTYALWKLIDYALLDIRFDSSISVRHVELRSQQQEGGAYFTSSEPTSVGGLNGMQMLLSVPFVEGRSQFYVEYELGDVERASTCDIDFQRRRCYAVIRINNARLNCQPCLAD